MSISLNTNLNFPNLPSETEKHSRITSDILSLFSDPSLQGKVTVIAFNFDTIEIAFIKLKETVKLMFGCDYPQSPPQVEFTKKCFDFLVNDPIRTHLWSSHLKLKEFVGSLYAAMKGLLFDAEKGSFSFVENPEENKKDINSDEIKKKKVMMNGCADNELTETKNLNRHFRSKLREVFFDILKDEIDIPENAKWIENSFALPRVGFEDISRLLKNEWFNIEVNKQMDNGKFMHKIMKGMMSIKSKKLMVKYYHVMLAAAREPDNFVKWKYQ